MLLSIYLLINFLLIRIGKQKYHKKRNDLLKIYIGTYTSLWTASHLSYYIYLFIYSSVKTNIGREFINLVKKHFNKNNPLSKIFNKHNMRVSYSCMANLERLIKLHNQKILINIKSILKLNGYPEMLVNRVIKLSAYK